MTDNPDRGSSAPQPEVKTGPNLALISFLVITAASVFFFVLNSDDLEINFLGYHHTTTIRWSILMSVLLGVLLDRVFSIWWRRRKRKNAD